MQKEIVSPASGMVGAKAKIRSPLDQTDRATKAVYDRKMLRGGRDRWGYHCATLGVHISVHACLGSVNSGKPAP